MLFPPESLINKSHIEGITLSAVPPTDMLQLPWENGHSWHFNGAHTWTGSDPGVMSSIDFVKNWSIGWGDDTSTDYVVAAHAGTATVFSSCFVRITASNGWATNYYHLDNLQVSSGETVVSNQIIGVYANNQSQALCGGGSSTGAYSGQSDHPFRLIPIT